METFLKKSFRDQDRDHRQQNVDHHDVINKSKAVQLLRSLNQLDHRNQDLDEEKRGLVLLQGTDDTDKSKPVQPLQSLNHDQRKQDLDRNRVCKVCGKTFRSGQALGGHISIHFQPHLGPNKMNFKATKHQQYYPFLNDKISCHVCNRIFPSMKSLYGHMGSHRKRAESSSMKHNSSPSSPSHASPSHYSSSSPSSSLSSAEYSEHDDRDLIEKDHGVIDFLSSWAKKDRRGRSVSTTTSKTLIADQNPNYNCDDVFASKYYKFPSSKRVKFLDGIKHDHQHVCNVCYKIFPTGQALGGHKRAHYNNEAGPLLEAAPPAAKIKGALMVDEDDGETIDPVVPSPLMQLAEEAIRLQSRTILDLDLNQPPPTEDDA